MDETAGPSLSLLFANVFPFSLPSTPFSHFTFCLKAFEYKNEEERVEALLMHAKRFPYRSSPLIIRSTTCKNFYFYGIRLWVKTWVCFLNLPL